MTSRPSSVSYTHLDVYKRQALYLLSPLIYAFALPQVSRVAIVVNLLTAFVMLGVGLACALKRQRSAYFFLAAFGLLILGGASTSLRAMGLLPTNACLLYTSRCV